MAQTRKDLRGRVLRKGESQRRSDERYVYTYTDPLGRRKYVYAQDLVTLREKEAQLMKDQMDGLDTVSYTHLRIVIGGRISTGSYKDKDGKTIYTTDVIVEEHEFAQNKDSGAGADSSETPKTDKDGFMEAKDGEIPFD